MIPENFVILGVLINFIGGISYVVDTIKGKIQPNRVSWGIWAIAPLIAFFAQINQGVGIQSLMTFMVGFSPLMIFVASFFNKKAYWKIGKFDIICGILSLSGLLLWYFTKVGNIAIIFSIFADFLAGVPTLRKSFSFPETENYIEFATGCFSAGITLLTIKTWTFACYSFPLYLFLFTLILIILIKFKLGKKLLNK